MPAATQSRGIGPPNEYLRYNTKISDSEAPVHEFWGIWNAPFIAIDPKPTLTLSAHRF